MKWFFYVIVFVYMFYRAVYGAKPVEHGLFVDAVTYGDSNFLKVGEHKTISCRSSNRNQRVEWVYPNGSLVKRIPGNRIFSQEHFIQSLRGRAPALVLTVTKAEVRDTGVYQCRAGDQTKDVSLCVINPSDFVDTTVDVNSDLGRSITLTCQAKGDPEPRLDWIRNGVTITDEDSSAKYRVMTKYNIQGFEGLLTITSLKPEDSGVYSCVSIQESSQDCSHTKTHNITLNVNYAPIFEDGNDTFAYGKTNQQVQIACSAQGFPVPTYRWFKELNDDSLLEIDKKQIIVSEEDNQAVITVLASLASFGTRYKCLATNEFGAAEKHVTLMRLEKPRKIDEVVYDGSDKEVELNVTWYDEINFPVNAFHIQYIQDENENKKKIYLKEAPWRKSRQIEVKVLEDDVRPEIGGTKVKLTDLEPETSYWMRLRASNEAGEAPWSDPVFLTTLVEEEEASTTPETPGDAEASVDEGNMNDSTFYGIFFAGGIFVVSFVCMFIMRMVR